MNIDIANKDVSKKLGINEKKVAKVTDFYWSLNLEHIYKYNPQPLNIENICVLYPDQWLLKNYINKTINTIRKIRKGFKYNVNSPKYNSIMEHYYNVLRNYLKIRKHYKYTN